MRGARALRRASDNLYQRVRALFFLYAIHRFHLPLKPGVRTRALIPFRGLRRAAEAALRGSDRDLSRGPSRPQGPSDAISSALAAAYHGLGFQTLADQVRRSVRSVRGNQWMFRIGHPADQPLRIRPELLQTDRTDSFPILREATPVRMDLTHSGWSDIFFLGMDFPEGARVLNVFDRSGVRGRRRRLRPARRSKPICASSTSRCCGWSASTWASADITNLAEVFDFAKDYLGLLKAAVIASGIVPPGHRRRGAASGRSARADCRARRAAASRSSATSTTFPKARGWPSPPICSPR